MLANNLFIESTQPKFVWSDILLNNFNPKILVNNNWLVMPEHFLHKSEINLLSMNQQFWVKTNKLIIMPQQFLADCDLLAVKINLSNKIISAAVDNFEYYQICLGVSTDSLVLVRAIFALVYQHINSRQAENIKLIQHETIRLVIAKIICNLDSAEKLLAISTDIYALAAMIDYLLKALQLLSKLHGGRAMLRGHAIELHFHLMMFKNLYLTQQESMA